MTCREVFGVLADYCNRVPFLVWANVDFGHLTKGLPHFRLADIRLKSPLASVGPRRKLDQNC